MSTIINADTSGGLKLTSDTSGEIKLQSAGADIATVNSSGITMASGKTLPATSLTTATGSAPSYSARAWVNFNGTGTVAIRDSGNVSSITDSGVGIYLVNFTTNMPDINYSVSLVSGSNMNNTTLHNTLVLTSSYRIHNLNDAGSYADASLIMSQVVR
jgi:filamentous hemagglutinin family protein